MNILHANTDPDLLTRLKEMLGSSARADIAVGYFFMSGFDAIADDLARLDEVRILVGRSDRQVVEEVALGLQQAQALQAHMRRDEIVSRRQRDKIAQRAVANIMDGVANLSQSQAGQAAAARYGGGRSSAGALISQKPAPRQGVFVLVQKSRRAGRGGRRLVQSHAGGL